MSRWARVSFIFALLGSCGPSLRMEHQGATYFERCYAADLDPSIRIEPKEACWNAWLAHYTGAQPPHRIGYAQNRAASLAAGETLSPLVGLPFELWDERQSVVFLSGVSDFGEIGESDPVVTGDDAIYRRQPPGDPEAPCADVCNPRFSACIAGCTRFPEESCADACEGEHRICLGAC